MLLTKTVGRWLIDNTKHYDCICIGCLIQCSYIIFLLSLIVVIFFSLICENLYPLTVKKSIPCNEKFLKLIVVIFTQKLALLCGIKSLLKSNLKSRLTRYKSKFFYDRLYNHCIFYLYQRKLRF